MKSIFLAFGAALTLFVTGCERSGTAPAGTVALLDFDAAAKRLGRDASISEELKAQNDALVEKLTKSRDDLQKKFDDSKQSVGDKPTDEQAQQLLALSQSMNAELQSKQQEARDELGAKQTALIRQFREEIRPVAQKIAAKKGMTTVLLRSDLTVLAADASVDITDDVVAEMIGAGKAPAATATPSPTAGTMRIRPRYPRSTARASRR